MTTHSPLRHSTASAIFWGGMLAISFLSSPLYAEDYSQTPKIEDIKEPAFHEGLNSLKSNLPLVASKQFKRAIEKQKEKLDRARQDVIKGFLAESLIRADSPQEALDLLTQLSQTPENQYWTSIALIKKGKLTEALKWLSNINLAPDADFNKNEHLSGKNMPLRHLGSKFVPGLSKAVLEAKSYIGLELGNDHILTTSLQSLAALKDSPDSFRSKLLLADTYVKKGEFDKAEEILRPFFQSSRDHQSTSISSAIKVLRPYAMLLMSKIDARKKQWNEASKRIETLINDQSLPARIKDLALIAQASIQMERSKNGKGEEEAKPKTHLSHEADKLPASKSSIGTGEDQLISFIASHPDSPLIVDAFNILIEERAFLTNPQSLEKLYTWVKSDNGARRPIATYALALTLYEKKDLDGAIKAVENGLAQNPDNPVTHALVLRALYWLLKEDKIDIAEKFLKKHPQTQSAQGLFSAGCIAYKRGEFDKADKLFNDAIKLGNDRIVPSSLYNANLAAMSAGNANSQSRLLTSSEASPELKERLAFEQAHYAAKQLSSEAMGKLSAFIASHPNSPLLIPATLDLIEVCLNQTPPDTAYAQKQLDKISSITLNEEELFRVACLKVLLDEVQQNWTQAIAGCRGILKSFPKHPSSDSILLKLGDLLYRNGDFNETLLVLQGLSEQYPKSEYVPAALFLAGKAAQLCNTESSLEKALDLFRQLSASDGAFSQSAQIEIASLLLRRGQAQEAIELLQKMLSGKLSKQTRLLALSIEADAWSSLSGSSPNALSKARELCSEMLSISNLKTLWKFKALSQRAQYAEKEGDLNAALSDYADILQYMDDIPSPNRRDWYWFYNAGFASLHLLEMKQKWDEALALATKLSQTTGPKAREAANIARRIKLEHFIWTEIDENETDNLHQKDIQLPVLKPLSK